MLSATDNGFVWVLLSIFIPSQIAVMILMSKFSKADGVVDVLDDRIGMLAFVKILRNDFVTHAFCDCTKFNELVLARLFVG